MNSVQIDFTRSGWRQFAKMNRLLGIRFIKGFILRRELAAYIAAHYESGNSLDPVCQEVRYEGGVYLLLQQCGSIWYITDIWNTEEPVGFSPVLFWKRVKRGCREILRQIVIGWCDLTRALEGEVVS